MYDITTPAHDGGTECPYADGTNSTVACNTQACPVNCVGNRGSWGSCNATCGSGYQYSTYTMTTAAVGAGPLCPSANGDVKNQTCNTAACPVNCAGSWVNTTSCGVTCGGGTLTSTYKVTTVAANGGTGCPYANNTASSVSCNTQACPVNCVGSWSSWSTCSAICGGGTQTRTYTITTAAANGGTTCANNTGATEPQPCNTGACGAMTNCVGS